MAGQKDRVAKNSWMLSDILVSAAVKAVEEDIPLSWSRSFRFYGSTWSDYKLASAWVFRERKRRSPLRAGNQASSSKESSYLGINKKSPISKAAKALFEADTTREAKKAEEDRLQIDAIAADSILCVATKSVEERAANWIKETALEFLWLIMIIPLGILFGFNYGGGIIAGIIEPILLVLGILILVFRFVLGMATALKSGKPIQKDWYK
jgi:hypothetical protein